MILKYDSVLLFFICIPFVVMMRYEKPVAEKLWRQRCIRNSMVLNDCNWCWCSSNFRYTCNARVCGEVDMFGHFNDAIQDINVGMEGHGVWRSRQTACEPGIHYARGELLCACTEDGNWPNPVCRDAFRVLYPVETVKVFKISSSQKCYPSNLYRVDCNVCLCPSTGYVDPTLCTDRKCSKDDRIPSSERSLNEVYAQCDVDKHYKLGCKRCTCLKSNRLICDNCTETNCDGKKPGVNFHVDCNTCHCDTNGTIYCTTNRCLKSSEETDVLKFDTKHTSVRSSVAIQNAYCQPGTKFRKGCNICYCFRTVGRYTKYGCTISKCGGKSSGEECDIGERYYKGCLRCHCGLFSGRKMEICEGDPMCHLRSNEHNYREYSQECKPMQEYKDSCNTCTCLADGKTVKCTNKSCEPVALNIIPIAQKLPDCPKGHTYKIDCNFCFCLQNGNALCTTMQCPSK